MIDAQQTTPDYKSRHPSPRSSYSLVPSSRHGRTFGLNCVSCRTMAHSVGEEHQQMTKRDGCGRVIVTFNIDRLIETAGRCGGCGAESVPKPSLACC